MAGSNGDDRERTEAPTQRRRQQARDEGQVAKSPEVAAAVVVVAGALLIAHGAGSAFGGAATHALKASFAAIGSNDASPLVMVARVREITTAWLFAWAPFALTIVAATTFVQLAQTRGTLTWKPLTPDLAKLSPLNGIKRVIGPDGLLTVAKSIVKLALLGLIAWSLFGRQLPRLLLLAETGPAAVVQVIGDLATRLVLVTGLSFLAVALVDYGVAWFRHEKGLRMSREEIVREHRETEGDPLIKARIRSIARAMARKRMMQHVPTADVVVVNPTHVAVALRYDPGEIPAPIVVAMGERRVAEKIREIATRAGVPIVQNVTVARALLATAVVGQAIPPALYVAVAEILAWVHRRHGLRHVARGRAA